MEAGEREQAGRFRELCSKRTRFFVLFEHDKSTDHFVDFRDFCSDLAGTALEFYPRARERERERTSSCIVFRDQHPQLYQSLIKSACLLGRGKEGDSQLKKKTQTKSSRP